MTHLIVLETDSAFVVAPADDPDDWIACFAKSATFPAQAWAERMAALYNIRQIDDRPAERPAFTGTYDPEQNGDSHA